MNGATGSIGATVAQLVTDLDKAEGEIDTLKSTTAGHTSTLAEHAKSIADNAKAIEDQATADAATYATIANLNKEIQDRKDAIDKEVSDRDAAILVETNRATGAESTLSGRIALLETADYQNSAQVGNAIDAKIATARTEISNEIDGDVAALKADIVKDYATKSALNEVDGKVSKNTGDISTLSTNLSNHTTYAEETYAKKNDVYTKTEVYTKDQVNDAIDADVLVEANRAKGEEARLEGLISEAKGIANDALTKADFEEFKTSNTTDIDAAKKAGDDAQKTIDDYATAHAGDYTNTQIDAAIKVVGDAASKNAGDISTLSESFNTYKTTVDNTYAKKSDVYTKTETYTQSEVDDAIEAAVLAETNRAKKAEEANASSISTLQGTVNKLDGADTVEGSVKQQIKVAKEALQAEIDADIRAANAMEFIDGVANSSALPATAKNGDTYVAEGAFTLNGSQVLPGDLLIATGSEDVDTGLITNPTWRIVHTGYDATLEQTLKTVDGKIQLTSAVGNANNGAVTFEAKVGTSATVAVANNTVTIGIEWDNF